MIAGTAIPVYVPLVLYVVLLGTAVIGFIAADTVRDEVTRQDMKLVKDTSEMRAMESKVISIASQAKGSEAEVALKKLVEALRFSDPVSSQALQTVETDLAACIEDIQTAVIDGDDKNAIALCQKASGILIERNRLCRFSRSVIH